MELATGWVIKRVVDDLVGEDRAKSRVQLAQFLQVRYAERFFDPIFLLEREATTGISWPKGNADRDAPGIRPYGFAIMSLACQMIETLESYKRGIPTTNKCDFEWMTKKDPNYKNSPKQMECDKKEIPGTEEAFKSFFSDYGSVFPSLKDKGDQFFRNVRNALLHQSQTRNGWKINIHQYEEAPEKVSEVYVETEKILYRDSFITQLRRCFNDFIENLRQHAERNDIWEKPERKIWWIAWLSDPDCLTAWVKQHPAYARNPNPQNSATI